MKLPARCSVVAFPGGTEIRNHRFCGSAISDKYSQPPGTPPHRFFLCIHAAGCLWAQILHPLTHPSHLWARDPACSFLWSHTHRAYHIIPCSLWALYPDFQFWRMCQRLGWALRDKGSMSHSYSCLKDLLKLKVTDSILSCTGGSVEELQHVKW